MVRPVVGWGCAGRHSGQLSTSKSTTMLSITFRGCLISGVINESSTLVSPDHMRPEAFDKRTRPQHDCRLSAGGKILAKALFRFDFRRRKNVTLT